MKHQGGGAYSKAVKKETLRIGKNVDSLERYIGQAYNQFKKVLKQGFLEEKKTYTSCKTNTTS